MRVLHLTPGCFDKGGISRYSRYQIAALRELGCEVRALSLLGPGTDGFETPFEVTWHGGGTTATIESRARFAARAAETAVRWRPHVIHCAHVNFTPMVSLLSRLAGARSILNVYGLELWGNLSPRRAMHLSRMDLVMADCHATADFVTNEGLHPHRPIVVWDCVDLDRFSPGPIDTAMAAKYGIPPDRRIVLTLGRLAKAAAHKGVDRLITEFASVGARVVDAHLVIAGKGDDRPRLEDLVRSSGIPDRVTFTGPVDEADLPALYRMATVFSLVSDKGPGRGEGIPLTPLEAMACGAPILVGNEDGSPEAVDRTRNGLVVSPRQQGETAEALCSLLQEGHDAATRRRVEARRVAEERFGYAAFRDKHRHLYARFDAKGAFEHV